MNCPKCGSLLPDNAKFCGKCGTILAEAVRETPPVPAAPVEDYRASAATGDYRAADSAPRAAAAEKKFAPKSLVSMILGISAVSCLTVALILVISGLSRNPWIRSYSSAIAAVADFTVALVFAIAGLPMGIVAVALSSNKTPDTKLGTSFRRVGRITGLIGLIGSAVTLVTSIIMLTVFTSYPYYH